MCGSWMSCSTRISSGSRNPCRPLVTNSAITLIVLPAAGSGIVLAEIKGFSLDSDAGTVGGLVASVLWKLLFCAGHCVYRRLAP